MEMNILLVEDDRVDVMAVERLFEKQHIRDRLHVARDGIEALEMLRGERAPLPVPRLILLDLKMPRMGGIEFLRTLRGLDDPELANLPVVVLTRSDLARDRRETAELGVSGYFVKDREVDAFVTTLAELLRDDG